MLTFGQVRMATPGDENGVMMLARMVHEEIAHWGFNEDKVRAMVRRATDRQGGILGVVGDPGDLLGCIYLTVEPVWYSDDWQLLELWNFVRPDARRSTHGRDMISFAKKVSDEMGLKLTIGIFNDKRQEAKTRLYDRQLQRAGAFYIHDPISNRAESA